MQKQRLQKQKQYRAQKRELQKEQQHQKKVIAPSKALQAGVSAAALALLAIVPARVGSEAIAPSTCLNVIQSGADISRGELSRLAAIPEGATEASVHQVISEPYCLLPLPDGPKSKPTDKAVSANANDATPAASRQAYPLAFDLETWVVVRYENGAYAGYDFVFKP